MELHVLTVNMPRDEVEFPLSAKQVFTDAEALRTFLDGHYKGWTSVVIVALPPQTSVTHT